MENNPLYRLYMELKDRVDSLSSQNNINSSTDSADMSDVIIRLRELEKRPLLDKMIHDLSVKIELLTQENKELKSKLDSLNKFENIETRLYNLEIVPKISLDPLNERLITLENNDFDSRINNQDQRLTTIEQYTNQISDLTYRINDIEKRPELSQRISVIESMLSNLNFQQEETLH